MTALDDVEREPWDRPFPTVVASWRRAWAHVIPFVAVPPEIRRDLHDERLESLNARIRKISKTRGHVPNDDAAPKLIWLALRNIRAA
jgi:transposase-like protein